jgi:RNA polymerase primary sigma factor
LTLRFGLDGQPPRTLDEIGAELGVTRERVRQLELRALSDLRTDSPGLRFYLEA